MSYPRLNPSSVSSQAYVRAALQQIWGYEAFRSPQGEIVQCLLEQRDACVIMPTGGGKSICFQLPALLQPGLTLVISPLVALMENQVQELRQRKLPAALLHSELPRRQYKQTLWLVEAQKLRLLYLSPETLLTPAVWQRLCQPTLKINALILDEAHCLTQWGETFRPAYYRLGAVRSALLQHKPAGSRIAIAAFTATANPEAQQTIERILRLESPQIFRCNPYRSNLHLKVQTVWTPQGRRQQLLRFIQARVGQAGLVYVRTRRDSEQLASWLEQQGYKTAAYHAGLGSEERRQIEQAWLSGAIPFVICTCAFGMGVNKSAVRWIVHFHAPALLSEYVQEIGRAGRDGQPADALMLISEPTGWLDPDDKRRRQFFHGQERKQRLAAQRLMRQLPARGEAATVVRQFQNGGVALSLLHSAGLLEWHDPFHYTIDASAKSSSLITKRPACEMKRFLRTQQCRWRFMLEAFGFPEEAHLLKQGCGHCDRCLK